MNRFFSNTFKVGLLACVSAAASLSGTAQAQMVPEGGGMKQELADKGYNFRLYGKFRPKVTFRDSGGGDDGDSNQIDVRDDSSRIGIQGKAKINDNLTAILRGEWRVEIGENRDQDGRGAGGSLGNSRLAYAALESKSAGFLGIGQQWNPYYDIAAAQVDVLYNASNTPVGYNGVGAPFRTSNFVKYAHSVGAFKFSAGIQADGSGDNAGVGGSNADSVDAFAAGAGFDVGKGYVGIAYWQQNLDNHRIFDNNGTVNYTPDIVDRQRTFIGIGASFNITDDFYVSALYQDIEDDNDARSCLVSDANTCVDDDQSRDPSALDIAAVYSFGDGMKLLAGAFTYDTDDGDDSRTKGMTLGVAKRLDKGMDVYVDWLREDPDAGDAVNQFNVGFRYSFDVGLL